MRGRASPAVAARRRTAPRVVMGAGEAAQLLLAGLQTQGWTCSACSTTTRPSAARASAACRCSARSPTWRATASRAGATHVDRRAARRHGGAAPRAPSSWRRRPGLPVLTVPSFSELQDGQRAHRAGAPHRARRPARPRAGAARRGRHRRLVGGTDRARHRRRRLDRLRAVPPGRALRPGAAGAVRAERVRALPASSSSSPSASASCRWRGCIGDVRQPAQLRAAFAAAAAAARLPRRRLQARAADGGRRNAWAALANNVLGTWHAANAAAEAGRRALRADLDRQGGQPDQRDGRHQARRRDAAVAPGGERPASGDALRARCASATCSARRAA